MGDKMVEIIVEVVKALQDAKIPTILVVGGIVFIFFAIGGGIAIPSLTSNVNRKSAGGLGALFLILGLVLSIPISLPSSAIPNSSSPITSTSIPAVAVEDIILPTTIDEAARKWGGQPSWWEKLSDTGWKLRGSLTITLEEDWRIDYMDANRNIKSCDDKYEPGVYGPTTVSVVEATLWYVPGETECPSWTTWSQNHP